ncbi:MAG: M1 family metallopeptidase, partial [Gemmatimonadaceae bacterium]
MTQRLTLAALIAGAAGCATPSATPSPVPAPEPNRAPSSARVPSPTPPKIIPGVRLVSQDPEAIPPFATEPLITWGPEPEGTVHTPPVRQFDLQRQIVNVRFDWPRHAVVGTTTLRFAALGAPLTTVRLNAVGMTFKRITAGNSGPVKFDYDDSIVVVHLPRTVSARAQSSLTIDYESVKPKKGVYFIDRNHYLWTQGETEDNRYWIPTYDHPDDKTTWEISVLTSPDEKALSNGRLVGSRRVGDGLLWTWTQDKPASTYLMSVVTGRYAVVNDHWNAVPVEYWTYPDSVDAAKRGFGSTPQAIDVFSRKTGVAYPWAKYAQSVVPDFIFGGMENVSATTQNDNGILHPSWAEPQTNADGLMSHELGHQWYGDLLTTADWSHAWLNEGFATFMEQTFREASQGEAEGAWDRLDAQAQTLQADRKNRRPIVYNKWVNAPLELFFSGHIYPKGATVLQMLRHQLGDSLFWHAMNHYTVAHAYQNVVSDDLRRSFEEATGRKYKAFFDQWVYGAGFPVFQASFAYDTSAKRVTLHATEIQPRDSLTGYFDADVDVEVLTATGPVRGVMTVRSGTGDVSLALTSAPLAIEWNRGKWILALSD